MGGTHRRGIGGGVNSRLAGKSGKVGNSSLLSWRRCSQPDSAESREGAAGLVGRPRAACAARQLASRRLPRCRPVAREMLKAAVHLRRLRERDMGALRLDGNAGGPCLIELCSRRVFRVFSGRTKRSHAGPELVLSRHGQSQPPAREALPPLRTHKNTQSASLGGCRLSKRLRTLVSEGPAENKERSH